MTPERFKVLLERRQDDLPRSVPWSLVAPHAERAMRNHDQTLERLHQRGGLSPLELWAVVHGQSLRAANGHEAEAIAWLRTVASVRDEHPPQR